MIAASTKRFFRPSSINNDKLRIGAAMPRRSHGNHEQAIIQPGYAVVRGVDASICWQQRLLLGERVQVHDQGLRRAVQAPRPVEELPPQRADMAAVDSRRPDRPPGRPPRCTPTPPASRSSATGPAGNAAAAVRALLVVAARHRVQELVMHAHPIALLVVLPAPERRSRRRAVRPRWSCTADASDPSSGRARSPGRRWCAPPARRSRP